MLGENSNNLTKFYKIVFMLPDWVIKIDKNLLTESNYGCLYLTKDGYKLSNPRTQPALASC